jgi:hypothetical protein
MIPALPGFTPTFGTKKESGGLSTSEVNGNVLMPFAKQRPLVVTENSTTTAIEADCRFVITAAGTTLSLGDVVFAGCEVVVVNGSSGNVTVSFSGTSITLTPGDKAELISNATSWLATQTAMSTPTANRIAQFDANKRLKSGAAPSAGDDVVRKTELDAEATARNNADSTLQTNINNEATARTNADNGKVDKNGTDSLMSAAEHTKLYGIQDGAQVNPGAATTTAAGLMSAADKALLDGYFDREHPIGDLYEQKPSTKSPPEKGWPGTWVNWSQRATLYAIAPSQPTAAFVTDWRSKRHDIWNLNTDGTVATIGTKKYSKPSGYVVVERQTLQANWGDPDLVERTSLVTYNGSTYYVWQVIALAGLFFGVDDTGYTGGGT